MLKRCVDLADLLASAATGQADVAVVSGELGGLDADAVMQLLRDDVRCVAVGGSGGHARPDRRGRRGRTRPTSTPLPEAVDSAGTRALVVDPDPCPRAESEPADGAPAG